MQKSERQDAFIEFYRDEMSTIKEACKHVDISRSTFYKWKKDEDFLERLTRTDEMSADVAKDCIFKAMKNGDTKVAMWYLERKGGFEKVASQQHIEVTHRAIAQIEVEDMTPEKFKALGAKAVEIIPTDEEDVMALAKARFGDDFTFEMPEDD